MTERKKKNFESFHEKDNRIVKQEKLMKGCKEDQQLKTENGILKHAALILE